VRGPRLPLILAVVALFAVACADEAETPPPTTAPASRASAEPPEGPAAAEGVEGVVAVGGLSNGHTEDPVEYPNYPPVGGDHFPVWQNCGVYTDPIPDELAVHSLEHGAVWITYQPDLDPAAIEQLEAKTSDSHVLVSPYPGLRAPVVVTAWGRQMDLTDPADPRLQQFLDTYLRAGDAPEPGARCDGGYAG
jgi:hypothetical protein